MEFNMGLTDRENEVIEMMRNGENHLHLIYLSEDKDKYALCITITGDHVKADYVIGKLFRDPDAVKQLNAVGGFKIHGISMIDPCTDMDSIQRDIDQVIADHPELQKYQTEFDEALSKNHILRAYDPNLDAPPPGYPGHKSKLDRISDILATHQISLGFATSNDERVKLWNVFIVDLQNILRD